MNAVYTVTLFKRQTWDLSLQCLKLDILVSNFISTEINWTLRGSEINAEIAEGIRKIDHEIAGLIFL